MTTLNKFDSEEEEWSWWEWFQILIKTFRFENVLDLIFWKIRKVEHTRIRDYDKSSIIYAYVRIIWQIKKPH